MKKILECVPNFSEAKNRNVIEQLMRSAENQPTVQLINVHSDIDHNRTVFTLIGESEPLQETMFGLTKIAAEIINLNEHRGCHPRIGATDVIPFIPLQNATMDDAVDAANQLGRRIGESLQIPVFLYGEAARIQEHNKLADIRRGGYERLRDEVGKHARTTPDFGPHQVGPAGASAIGARFFLIAFNIFLNSADLCIAKDISSMIRESSGGMKKVQALGMLVNNQAQVSMNLTDYRVTALDQVYERVQQLANEHGIEISHSELVGCVPKQAICGTDLSKIKLIDFSDNRIIETHLDKLNGYGH